jgi:hypothetical protein
VKDVVDALVAASSLDGFDVGGLLYDADEAVVAGGAGAVDAGVYVGDIVADGTETQSGFEASNGLGKRGGILVCGAQNMECVALRAFGADAWKLL